MLNNENFNLNVKIIQNLNELKNEKDYLKINQQLENVLNMVNNIKKDNEIIDIINKFNEFLFINNNNTFLSLNFYMIINSKKIFLNKILIEKLLIDNKKNINNFIKIFKEIYFKNNNNNIFEIPNFNIFLNFTFKFPDIVNNYFEYNFINFSLFFEEYLKNLIIHKIYLNCKDDLIIQKIYNLKLFNILFSTLIKSNEITNEINNEFFNHLNQNYLLHEEFIKKFFQFGLINNSKENFLKILNIYNNLKEKYKFGKIYKTIKKNNFFISLLLASKNEKLKNNYFNLILNLLKEKKSNILEEIEIYDFYQIFFSIYFLLEKFNLNDEEFLNICDSIQKIIFIVFEIVDDKNKKGIIELLMKYIQNKMKIFIEKKGKEFEHKFENFSVVFDEKQNNFLDFKKNKENFEKNIFLFLNIENDNNNNFYKNFYEIILNVNFNKYIQYKNNNINNNNNLNKKNISSKTKYKSIKFQKKYGIFNKNKNNFIEIDSSKNNNENDEIKFPFNNNNSFSNLNINLVLNDDYSDLKKLKPPNYIKDCILSLNSEFKDRQELALKSLPNLIESQPLDLDLYLEDLSNMLLKTSNNFDIENFEEILEIILVKLTKYNPNKLTLILCNRFFSDDNCGLKYKFIILNVLNSAVNEISEYYIKNKKPKTNKFHIYFINVIFPLLNYLKKNKIEFLITFDDFDLLLAKFIFLISNMINVSENHPLIYKVLFETFDLFNAIINLKNLNKKSFTLLESLNSFVFVNLNFYNENFINIYPEYLNNFIIEIKYLNNLLDDKELNNNLRFHILETLNKYTIKNQNFRENFFSGLKLNN